jgi:hypothetical protein
MTNLRYILFIAAALVGQAQSQPAPTAVVDVSGDWQASWQGRLGAEPCAIHILQDGGKLTGTLQDSRSASPLTGTIDGKTISFDVQFSGRRPFTIHFTGTVADGKIEGISQAVGIGATGAYLGHGGEVKQPEHPWTASRPKL